MNTKPRTRRHNHFFALGSGRPSPRFNDTSRSVATSVNDSWRAIRPFDDHRANAIARAEPDVNAIVTRAQIASVRSHPTPQGRLAIARDAHAGADSKAVSRRRAQRQLEPMRRGG